MLCLCCAQVLSNSYAFAYFFFGGQLFADEFTEDENRVNQNLFEDSQEMLAGEVGAAVLYAWCRPVEQVVQLPRLCELPPTCKLPPHHATLFCCAS
jgi:hypothetical protein